MPEDAIESNDDVSTEGLISAEPIEYARPTTPHVNLASGITRGDIAALAVRLVGIYMVVVALPAIGYVIAWLVGPMRWSRQAEFYWLYELVFLGGGAFMIVKAAMIGGWLLPKATMNPDVLPATGSPHELQAAAFSVVGVILAVSACPSLIGFLADYGSGTHGQIRESVRPGVELVVGLLLFFRGKRLARYWQALPASAPARTDGSQGPL